jgi:hypothetical protein
MKRAMSAVAAVLACLLPAAEALAALSQDRVEAILGQVGFQGTVRYQSGGVNHSHWNPMTNMINASIDPMIPEKGQIYVLLHEAAHEQQAREGMLPSEDEVWVPLARMIHIEWDADVRALKMGCQFGVTKEDFLAYWEHRTEVDGYGGDLLHGSLAERVGYVMQNAPRCLPPTADQAAGAPEEPAGVAGNRG